MNYSQSEQAILAAFQTGWIGAAAIRVEYPNRPFDVPKGKPWARVSIPWGNRGAAAIGKCRTRAIGFVMVQFFLPEDKGLAPAKAGADLLASIFDTRTMNLGGGLVIVFDYVSLRAPLEREGYSQQNADVEFRVDLTT